MTRTATVTRPAAGAAPPKSLATLADTLAVVSDPTRLRIFDLLAIGERNVTELCLALGGIAQPGISHHLRLLLLMKLVDYTRHGKFSYYTLTSKGWALHGALTSLLESMEAAP